MAKRIPWDEYEAVYLLDNCIKVNNKEISWKEAVSKVSKELRQRAISKGMRIDAIFRNEAGIALQMLSMKECYLGEKNTRFHRTIPELFKKIVKIYKEDRKAFNEILRSGQVGKYMLEVKKEQPSWIQFQIWLKDSGYSEKIQDFFRAMKKVETFAYMRRMIKKSLFELTDIKKIEQLKVEIQNPKGIGIGSRKEVRDAYTALELYCRFLMGEKPGKDFSPITPKTVQPEGGSDFYSKEKFLNWMFNEKGLSLRTSQVYSCAIAECERLADQLGLVSKKIYGVSPDEAERTISLLRATEEYKERCKIYHRFTTGPTRYLEYISKDKNSRKENHTPIEINVKFNQPEGGSDFYSKEKFLNWMFNEKGLSLRTSQVYSCTIAECEHFAAQVGSKNPRIYGVSYNEARQTIDFLEATEEFKEKNNVQHHRLSAALRKYLEYISKGKRITGGLSSAEVQNHTRGKVSQETYLRYAEILEKYFGENGFRPGHPIFMGRLKNYYELEYGNEPAESDGQIELILKEIGTIRDGRIFPKQGQEADNLINKIVADIISVFNSGMECVFIDAVYEKYKKDLANCLKIYNEDEFTKLLLSAGKGKLKKKKSCLMQSGKNVNINPSVAANIMHIMEESYEPLSCSEVHQKAWYIPIDKIKAVLGREKAIVNVDTETYFYAPNLPVEQHEIHQLTAEINAILDSQNYLTGVELQELIDNKVPSIALNTGSYTAYGLRNCLGYILRRQFAFNGPIISKVGQELSMKEIYAGFARAHDVLNIEELKQFSEEVGQGIYWNVVLKEKVRISEECMISKDQINFDVERIDEFLEKMYPNEYTPIKDVRLFIHFPEINYQWNHYVLESYLFNYSKKFRLIHVSFTQDDVYGAMVNINSPISDYRALLVDALSHSNALASSSQALQYIVDHGYQRLRKYTGIDDVIVEAKTLKENRKKIRNGEF